MQSAEAECSSVDKESLVERLVCLFHTRLDIAYSVSLMSQFMHDPRDAHMQAIFSHFQSLIQGNVCFSLNKITSIDAFIDTYWGRYLDDRRSTSGYCTLIEGNLVIWRSKKQSVVTRSREEAEDRVIARVFVSFFLL